MRDYVSYSNHCSYLLLLAPASLRWISKSVSQFVTHCSKFLSKHFTYTLKSFCLFLYKYIYIRIYIFYLLVYRISTLPSLMFMLCFYLPFLFSLNFMLLFQLIGRGNNSNSSSCLVSLSLWLSVCPLLSVGLPFFPFFYFHFLSWLVRCCVCRCLQCSISLSDMKNFFWATSLTNLQLINDFCLFKTTPSFVMNEWICALCVCVIINKCFFRVHMDIYEKRFWIGQRANEWPRVQWLSEV